MTRRSGSKHEYIMFHDLSSQFEVLGQDVLNRDGHPSYLSDHEIITDTYPDAYRDQHLIYYNDLQKQTTPLFMMYIPMRFKGEVRCDFHPRLSSTKKYICIDSINQGLREMLVFSAQNLN